MSTDLDLFCGMLFCLCTILDDCSRPLPSQTAPSPEQQPIILNNSITPPTTSIIDTQKKDTYIPPPLPPVIL